LEHGVCFSVFLVVVEPETATMQPSPLDNGPPVQALAAIQLKPLDGVHEGVRSFLY
jgi:hypothetical protein